MEPARVQLRVRVPSDGRVVVHLTGELDLLDADGVRRILIAEAQTATVVAVDLVRLSFIDLSGVRALDDAQRAAAECGSTLVLVSPPRCLTMLARLMELGGLPFSEDRSVLEEPRLRMDGHSRPVGMRARTRRVRADGARAWRTSPQRTEGSGGPSCASDDSA